MSDFINTIDVIGDDALTDSILMRTVTEYKSDTVTKIGNWAFHSCSKLTTVDVPNITQFAGHYVFGNCSNLKNINFPKLTHLNSQAFYACTSLTSIELPEVVGCVNGNANEVFYLCSNLVSISMPKLLKIPYSFCSLCTKLANINFPVAEEIDRYAFNNAAIQVADFPSCKNLKENALYRMTKLKTLILRRTDVVCTLGNVSAFNQTPFASGGTGGTVYVPSALIESYKTATNWSTLYAAGTCNFVAIEGSEYE